MRHLETATVDDALDLLHSLMATQLAADGFPVTDESLARFSPLQYDHINFLGRYAFTRPPVPGLRQPRDPHGDDGEDEPKPVQAQRGSVMSNPDTRQRGNGLIFKPVWGDGPPLQSCHLAVASGTMG
ncbi:hypothetical protein [Streptomyces sp. NPDC093990]|uniref:hypothetical protein n=1 Tax=Streptomyces sp. NPDC093990 TaxID=3155306 RepID=UPI003415C410